MALALERLEQPANFIVDLVFAGDRGGDFRSKYLTVAFAQPVGRLANGGDRPTQRGRCLFIRCGRGMDLGRAPGDRPHPPMPGRAHDRRAAAGAGVARVRNPARPSGDRRARARERRSAPARHVRAPIGPGRRGHQDCRGGLREEFGEECTA